ncbi:TetR/AcrR family transcriptional regulator [Nitrosospira lacus]|uniref:TetR family transcriptional regulator n=1 Tax=Nitrosospira lacus TaxID=1288494 RepID=A0A1W6SR04_9PROT|nr:TetR/AcrR family transcriptional regulator [Nitrosospira lacus]ARO88250.1 TetR/AcrR family transcriptional regulator [Nitrosospira lacus]
MHIKNHFAELGRRERKRLQLLDNLADTAWALFESEGFAVVTMERIADVADVAKGTLYKHFSAKEALLCHRFHRELEKAWPEVLADITSLPSFEGQLRAFLERSAAWSQSHRAFLLPYVQFRLSEPRRRDDDSRSGLDCIFGYFIAQGQASEEFCAACEPAILAVYLEFLYLAALLRWLLHEDLSLTEEFSRMLDLFLFGLRPRP